MNDRSADREELASLARAGLTSATLLVAVVVLAVLLPDRGAGPLWVVVAASAVLFPLVALACAAPTFSIGQFLLNGIAAVIAVPMFTYLMFDLRGSGGEVPAVAFALVLVSGPAFLGLAVTGLAWVAIEWMPRLWESPPPRGSQPRVRDVGSEQPPRTESVVAQAPEAEPMWLVVRTVLAVTRATLTSITVIFSLGMLFFVGAHFDGDSELWAMLVASAVAFPLVALAYSAPSFQIPEYVLNGGFATLAFPMIVPLLYRRAATDGAVPHDLGIALVFAGPALLSLSATTLVWVAIKRSRQSDRSTLPRSSNVR